MSHHGQNENHQMPEEFLKLFQRQIQGEFPDGRLNKDDEGAIGMTVGQESGKVIMRFPSQITWIGFTPKQAVEIAEILIKHARGGRPTQVGYEIRNQPCEPDKLTPSDGMNY